MNDVRRFFVFVLIVFAFALPALAQDATGTPTPAPTQRGGRATAVPTTVPAADDNTLEFGGKVTGELNADTPSAEYTFEGEEGQLVVITLVADGFDTFLQLIGPSGDQLTVDDDSGPGDLNSRIGPYPLPDTGTYTIVADSYSHYYNTSDDQIEGEFELDLAEISGRRIEYTQEVKGALSDENSQEYYLFRGQQGDVINISESSSDFTGMITLSQNGAILTSADGSYSEDASAVISGFTLPQTGDYIIGVNSLTGTETGDFSLALGKIEVTDISYGDEVEGSLSPTQPLLYYRFEGEAGDVVDATVQGDGELDTTLTINGPDSYQVGYADDTNDLDPAINSLILTQSGTYTILVKAYSAGDSGDITLSLERGELKSLDEGDQTLNLSSERSRDTMSFEGIAGESVRLTLEVLKGDQAAPNITVTQAQQSLAYASASTVQRQSIDFRVLNDGPVYVQVDEYSYTDVTIRVTLEHLGTEDTDSGDTAQPTATIVPTTVPQPAATVTPSSPSQPEPTVVPTEMPAPEETDVVPATAEPTVEPPTDATAEATAAA
jgi:hypothetical protein